MPRRTAMTPIAAACKAAADILASIPRDQPPARDAWDLLSLIRGLDRSLFMAGGGLRLSALRGAAQGWAREDVDRALRELEIGGLIVNCHFDDPSLVRPGDREAALRLGGGIERHYLFVR
jgi:hypothetical protein